MNGVPDKNGEACPKCGAHCTVTRGSDPFTFHYKAAPSTEAPPISTEFAEFIGRLSDLAHTSSFWEEKPYGNRLYYGIGAGDYIAKDVLHAFLHAIKNAAPAEGDLTASGTSPATNPTEQPALPSARVPSVAIRSIKQEDGRFVIEYGDGNKCDFRSFDELSEFLAERDQAQRNLARSDGEGA